LSNLATPTEGLACIGNSGSLFYSGTGTVTITPQANFASFDSFLVLYKATALGLGSELPAAGFVLASNHPLSGPFTFDPAALGFLAGQELVFALGVDTTPPGTFASIDYRVFMGPAGRNTPIGIQDDLEFVSSTSTSQTFLVGFEDRLSTDPLRDGVAHEGDFNDHIFQFTGALLPPPPKVPNPGALWLLGMGLLGIGIVGRRRARQ
jgi:hypothetical protein